MILCLRVLTGRFLQPEVDSCLFMIVTNTGGCVVQSKSGKDSDGFSWSTVKISHPLDKGHLFLKCWAPF